MIQQINLAGKVTGQHTMTGLSSAKSVAGVGNKVILQAETEPVRVRYGAAPTSSIGLLLAVGTVYELKLGPEQHIHELQVIEAAAGASLNVVAIRV